MFDWRTWLYEKLLSVTAITDLVDDRIYSELEETPALKPFIVFRFSPTQPQAVVGMFQDVVIWFHDVGGYTRIDQLILATRTALVDQVSQQDAIGIDWSGDSADLADDARQTVVRNSTFRFAGRR